MGAVRITAAKEAVLAVLEELFQFLAQAVNLLGHVQWSDTNEEPSCSTVPPQQLELEREDFERRVTEHKRERIAKHPNHTDPDEWAKRA